MKHVFLAILLLTACGRQAPPAEPDRLGFTDPIVETECTNHPCWCNDPTTWAQAANHSHHTDNYPGNGTHHVTLVFPGPGIIDVWPQGACGDLVAASGICWCIMEMGHPFRESELVRRTLHQWGPVATFYLVAGRGYWARQDTLVVPIPATVDTVVVW